MPKRKLEQISGAAEGTNYVTSKAVRLQRQQLGGLLEQGKTTLFRSLKVARGIERQKLGRRQKTAKAEGNGVDTIRLNAEVTALKSLDLATTADIQLYKSLLKIKSIVSAPSFPTYVQTIVDKYRKPMDAPSANVQARLFKSGPVQEAMVKSISRVRALLGIPETSVGNKKRMRAKDYANLHSEKDTHRASLQNTTGDPTSTNSSDDMWGGLSNTGDTRRNTDIGQSSASEEDYKTYASRLASSSDDDSNPDEPASDNEHPNLESITEDSSDKQNPPPKTKPPKPPTSSSPRKPPPTPTTTKTTTFLPSLSLGGYISGSGSSSADDLSDDQRPQERRNKRGQQARRAIWEKKFGKNANHLKKQQPVNRDDGWDARRGASAGGDERGKRGRERGRGGGGMGGGGRGNLSGGRGPMSSGANNDPVVMRKTRPAADAPLHPSWEAAKKAKEQKKVVPFQGKKVVFD